MAPLREPNKLQRLSEAVEPACPTTEFIDQGTCFDAALLEPVSVLAPVQPNAVTLASKRLSPPSSIDPINSSTSTGHANRSRCVAAVFQGIISCSIPPEPNHRHGPKSLLRRVDEEKRKHRVFLSAQSRCLTHDERLSIQLLRHSAERSEGLKRRQGGEIKARLPLSRRFSRPGFTYSPSRGVAD